MRRSFHRSGARWNFLRGMTQHEEQTGETEVEPELEQAKRKLGEGQIHRKSLERSFVCGFEGMSDICLF